jgi:hypothetical protein
VRRGASEDSVCMEIFIKTNIKMVFIKVPFA